MTQEKPQGGSERPENGPVDHFQRRTGRQALDGVFRQENRSLRLFRPGALKGRQEKPQGVLSARKMVRWTIFSEERAGRPWL